MELSRDKRISNVRSVIETGLILLLSGLLLWKGLIPAWNFLNTDFPNYYVAARLIREHYCLDRIYEWIWFQRAADHFGIRNQLVGFLGLTPFSAFPIIPLSSLPVLEAKRFWIVFNLVLLAGSIELLKRQTGISRGRAWIVALCAVIPLRTSFLYGQMHILVLALLVVAYVSHMRGWQISSGCCIAIAAALKIYPILFFLYFVLKRRWKALGATVSGILLCLGVSCLVVGQGVVTSYLFEQLPRLLQGESQNPFSPSLTSASALFHRLFLYEPELNPYPLIASAGLLATLYPLWQALLAGPVLIRIRPRFQTDDRETLEWSMFLCLLMFLSSAPASYQFVVLIAAAVPTMAVLENQRGWKAGLIYLSLYFLACNIRTIHLNSAKVSIITPAVYLTLWCGVMLLVFYQVLLESPLTDRSRRSVHFFEMPAFRTGVVVLCLWVAGSMSAWSHLKSMQTGDAELVVQDSAYLRTSPIATDSRLLYVAMQREGYRVRNAEMAAADIYADPGPDQLGFAAGTLRKELWIELASGDGSQLVHSVSGKRVRTCEISNGELPVLSADETQLAFLREDQGRGSLWTVNLRDCGIAPERLTSSMFDVRTLAAGPGGSFVMSAIDQGKERIFGVSPGTAPQLLAEADGPLNSPTLSPDGRQLAVRELISHRWQLASFDLSSHAWKRLTHGDCNAYTPSWQGNHALLYATDCRRGMGLTALAPLKIDR